MKIRAALFFMLAVLIAGGTLVYISVGGRGSSPEAALASLATPDLSEEYTSAFWARERSRDSPLWGSAVENCRRLSEPESPPRPNCSIIAVVSGGGYQEELARQLLIERERVKKWVGDASPDDIGSGFTGRGARELPSSLAVRRSDGGTSAGAASNVSPGADGETTGSNR